MHGNGLLVKEGVKLVDLVVCVGSSCHMKGSYQVIKTFTDLVKVNELENDVTIKASFCMGRCLNGISVMVGDTPIQNVGFANADTVFYEQVMPAIEAAKQKGE